MEVALLERGGRRPSISQPQNRRAHRNGHATRWANMLGEPSPEALDRRPGGPSFRLGRGPAGGAIKGLSCACSLTVIQTLTERPTLARYKRPTLALCIPHPNMYAPVAPVTGTDVVPTVN